MVENERAISQKIEEPQVRVFDNPPKSAPKAVIAFLQFAEQEGSYATLSESTRQRLEMRFLHRARIAEIAGLQDVTKQAVSQTLRSFSEFLYNKMAESYLLGKGKGNFIEIDKTYQSCTEYLAEERKRSGAFSKKIGKPQIEYIDLAIGE